MSDARSNGPPDAIDPLDPLAPGRRLGNYEIVRLIGRGGMGAVYEAEHIYLRKPVALKALLGHALHDASLIQRFMQEGMAASRVGHEGIVNVSDSGVHEGIPFLVMELLHGESLAERIQREGRLTPVAMADVMVPVCAALAAAHAAGVLHRDLKPDNVFVTRGRRGAIPKLVDFGISKLVAGDDVDMSLTRTGTVVGTPHYMSPEQAIGRGDVDEASDQYAVGVMMYECLAGAVPFDGDNYLALIHAVVTQDAVPVRQRVAGVSDALDAIVMRAMSRDRAARYPTIGALGLALVPFASGSVQDGWRVDLETAAGAPPARMSRVPGMRSSVPGRPVTGSMLEARDDGSVTTIASAAVVPATRATHVEPPSAPSLVRSDPRLPPLITTAPRVSAPPAPSTLSSPRITAPPSPRITAPPAPPTSVALPVAEPPAPARPVLPADPAAEVDKLLGPYSSGIVQLPRMEAVQLECLIAVGLLDPEARQNDGPRAADIVAFMHRWRDVTAHGYVFSRRRDERYVTINGIACELAAVAAADVARLRTAFLEFGKTAGQLDDGTQTLFASWR